ncbi:MAG: rhomboid family intramembrane serine protease [Rhodanobacter sp.]|jgi:membrane associated rhomboid family serine protease|nr:rhomboid family intramembrane serine protease [Rhodanobacter sp.]
MLIVPLHRSLNRANFPLMTAALILINCLVFLSLQADDASVFERAFENYRASGLDRIEFPAFFDWLEAHEQNDLSQAIRTMPAEFNLRFLQGNTEFIDALEAGEIIAPTRDDYAQWRRQRDEFDRLWQESYTERFKLRFSHIEPVRMFGAMFLHGSFGHLVGNMIFLAVLGLLVEGALGPWLFLALYLTGGLGAQLVSLAVRWGEHGSGLGASGAIAGLIGAYCVLWGLRKVRVFYWFFVVFDYVRVPAIALLPVWAGWEIFNFFGNRQAHILFDAHAGGMVCGALLALGARRLGWEREEFLAEDERVEQREHNQSRFELAMQCLGRLEVVRARGLLEEIDAQEPGRLDVAIALYRCARYRGDAGAVERAAKKVFSFDTNTREAIGDIGAIWIDYARANAPGLPVDRALRFVQSCMRLGADDSADAVLRILAAHTPSAAGVDAAWFVFVLRAAEGTASRRARLEFILRHFPQSGYAAKARFLLQN